MWISETQLTLSDNYLGKVTETHVDIHTRLKTLYSNHTQARHLGLKCFSFSWRTWVAKLFHVCKTGLVLFSFM